MDQVWQLVLMAWGTKYGAQDVNRLVAAVRAHAANPPRVVLLSDRDRPGLAPGIALRPIPQDWLAERFRGSGCQAKLAIFAPGVVPADLPALFLDLDTMVMGDVERILRLRPAPETIAILQSAVLPFGPLARLLFRLTKGRRYARGNSSVIAYDPARCGFVAERFRALEAERGIAGFKPLRADERFLSWVAQPRMMAVPRAMAVKFPTEFMHRPAWLGRLLQALPWVAARRAGLLAVTFPGFEVKFAALLALEEGARVTDRKGRVLIWSARTLGPLKARIRDYWAGA